MVGNPEVRFSHNEALIPSMLFYCLSCRKQNDHMNQMRQEAVELMEAREVKNFHYDNMRLEISDLERRVIVLSI